MDPPVSIQPAPPNTSPSELSSVPENGHPSPATYRLRISLQVLKASILIVIGFVTLLGLPPAIFASIGALPMLIGNNILRNSDPHYTNNASAASIGVVGSLILSPPLYLLYLLIIPTSFLLNNPILIVFGWPLFSSATGLIGSTILLHSHIDLGGIDILRATLAGLFGSTSNVLPMLSIACISHYFFRLVSDHEGRSIDSCNVDGNLDGQESLGILLVVSVLDLLFFEIL